ncbi:hypothetical protein V1478_009117, partial [Vespula squamosa]
KNTIECVRVCREGCREHRQKRAPRIHIPTGSDIERNPSRNLCHKKKDGNRTTPGNVSPHLKLVEVEIDSPFLKRPTPYQEISSLRRSLASLFTQREPSIISTLDKTVLKLKSKIKW